MSAQTLAVNPNNAMTPLRRSLRTLLEIAGLPAITAVLFYLNFVTVDNQRMSVGGTNMVPTAIITTLATLAAVATILVVLNGYSIARTQRRGLNAAQFALHIFMGALGTGMWVGYIVAAAVMAPIIW